MKQITIKDIAKELGLGVSTVSRALTNAYGVKPETKEAVLELAKKYDYRPNAMAQGLLRSSTQTIGVIVPQIENPFFSSVIGGLEEVAYNNHYKVLICQTNDLTEREVLNLEALVSNRVDGIIASLASSTTDTSHFRKIYDKKIPLVLFDRVIPDLNVPKIIVDDFEGAYAATQHLIDEGCQNILHVAGPDMLDISKKRIRGFKAALTDHKKYCDPKQIISCDLKPESIAQIINQVVDREKMPDGIFAFNDSIAIEFIKKLTKLGIKVPHAIAIIGFSNIKYADSIQPPLSSIVQPAKKIGELSMNSIINLIEAKEKLYDQKADTTVLPTTVSVKASSQKSKE